MSSDVEKQIMRLNGFYVNRSKVLNIKEVFKFWILARATEFSIYDAHFFYDNNTNSQPILLRNLINHIRHIALERIILDKLLI